MEILRRTPWSRIREQQSLYKESLEIVHKGNKDGAVSVTMPTNMQKAPVVECLEDCARITSKELALVHSVKSGTLQIAESGCRLVKMLSRTQPSKRSEKNAEKSAILK